MRATNRSASNAPGERLTLQILPREVLFEICSHLQVDHDDETAKGDLAHLSTTCRALREPAQSHIMRHLSISLQGAGNAGRVAQRLLNLTTCSTTASSVTIRLPSDDESAHLVPLFSAALQYFFITTKRGKRISHMRLIVRGACWLHLLEDILSGCASLRHLEIRNCFSTFLTSATFRNMLNLAPSCEKVTVWYKLDYNAIAGGTVPVPGTDDRVRRIPDLEQLFQRPIAQLKHLHLAIASLREPFALDKTTYLPYSFLAALTSLTIDPANISDVYTILEAAARKKGECFLEDISVTDATVADNDTYNWLQRRRYLPNLLSLCPRLKSTRFSTGPSAEEDEGFVFTELPVSISSLAVRIVLGQTCDSGGVRQCFTSLPTFLAMCRCLREFNLSIEFSGDEFDEGQRKWACWAYDDEDAFEELAELRPEVRLRYPYDPHSVEAQLDDFEIPEDVIDADVKEATRQWGVPALVALREARYFLSSHGITHTFDVAKLEVRLAFLAFAGDGLKQQSLWVLLPFRSAPGIVSMLRKQGELICGTTASTAASQSIHARESAVSGMPTHKQAGKPRRWGQ